MISLTFILIYKILIIKLSDTKIKLFFIFILYLYRRITAYIFSIKCNRLHKKYKDKDMKVIRKRRKRYRKINSKRNYEQISLCGFYLSLLIIGYVLVLYISNLR